MRILVVEDEEQLSEAVGELLEKQNYIVDRVFNGEDAVDNIISGIYDLVVLDIMIPKKSGLEVLKYVRSHGLDVPIILLTAKGEISDKITGLDLGADDYMAKPFSAEELLARIRALLRRKGEINFDNLISFEDVSLDIGTLKLKKDNDEITLTAKESALIELLIKKSGIVASKEEIINKIWGYESDADDNNVEVYITFLRKKLKFLKSDVSIKAIRNAGYILCLKS